MIASEPAKSAASLRLLPCAKEDMPLLTPIYMSAFKDSISHICFPRSAATTAWWTSTNEADFREQKSARYLKVVTEENGVETIIAYGKWNVPIRTGNGVENGGDDVDGMPLWPEGGYKQLSDEFFGTLARKRLEIMGDRPHYYLEIVATLPSYQGRGAATQIIRWGLERADEEGLEAYVEAGPGLLDLYGRYGWEIKDSFSPQRLQGEKYVESMMVRQARGSCSGRQS